MLHSTHGIDGARKMVVYVCLANSRAVGENGGNCCTGTGHVEGYLDEFTLVDYGNEGKWIFLTQSLCQNRDI